MSASEYDRILVHYAEIGTKGGNRPAFEARLRRNIAGALTGLGAGGVRREPGRIGLELRDQEDLEPVMARLGQIPGVAWFAPARTVESDLDAIRDAVVEMAVSHEDGTFRLDTRRSYKPFPHDSLKVNREVGAAVVQATGRSVSLGNPDKRYGVHIDKGQAFVFWDRREGVGGLPVGTQGSLVCLVSGGIDSPVAAFRMMLRGCTIQLVHFLNRSIDTNRVVKKIRALAERLSLFHGPIVLTMVPFDDLQREIVMVVPAKYRMIVYRRVMFRIAEVIRKETRSLGFVTGDSVGQVASQTLENLRVIRQAVTWPVYSPLSGSSKREIVDEAKAIGTFEISTLPHEDCCSFLVAKHPETRASLNRIESVERFDVQAGVESALEGRERLFFDPRPGRTESGTSESGDSESGA